MFASLSCVVSCGVNTLREYFHYRCGFWISVLLCYIRDFEFFSSYQGAQAPAISSSYCEWIAPGKCGCLLVYFKNLGLGNGQVFPAVHYREERIMTMLWGLLCKKTIQSNGYLKENWSKTTKHSSSTGGKSIKSNYTAKPRQITTKQLKLHMEASTTGNRCLPSAFHWLLSKQSLCWVSPEKHSANQKHSAKTLICRVQWTGHSAKKDTTLARQTKYTQ